MPLLGKVTRWVNSGDSARSKSRIAGPLPRSRPRGRGGAIDALYDIRTVRIRVADVGDCYAALGIVHQLWTLLAGEFDDYIAKPKANAYRSLHMAVIGAEGKPLELQIRTWDMHQHSEYGVAAHWRYKESGARASRRDRASTRRSPGCGRVLDWKDAVADAGEWLTECKDSLFTDSIYVLTPQGKVVDLPRDATPVDFADAVHPISGTAAAVPASTGRWCRSTIGWPTDSASTKPRTITVIPMRIQASSVRSAAKKMRGSFATT